MNPLTHAKFSLEWLRLNGFRLNEPLVAVGSILPDLAYMGFIPERAAHRQGGSFLRYLKQHDYEYASLGAGFMLHGEKPYCLDYFTHRKNGYISRKAEEIMELVERAKLKIEVWYKRSKEDFVHSLIEFSGDTLIEPEFVRKLDESFKSVDIDRIATHLSRFFNSNQQKILRALQYFKTFDFQRLHTPKGVVSSIQDFAIIRAFSHNNNTLERYNALVNKLNFWRAYKLKKIIHSARENIADDYHEFLASTQDRIARHTTRQIAGVLT